MQADGWPLPGTDHLEWLKRFKQAVNDHGPALGITPQELE